MLKKIIECRRLDPTFKQALTDFFLVLLANGDEKFFHPHPLTSENAEKLTQYNGKDQYYIMVENSRVLAYGMLRGWDEGYSIPSLGISVHPEARGKSVGKTFMPFLHLAAQLNGASTIMLKAYAENTKAINFFKSLGYIFDRKEGNQLIGQLDLK